jgi:hypothetical protein
MDKRIRSPNYPSIGLKEAITRVTALYKNQHTHWATREVVAKGMGYSSLNGASASAISALHKYGLLERQGEEIRVSDRALRILHPQSPDEKAEAIGEAASEPQLFVELAAKFPGRLPSEEVLRNYLIRNGFSPGAVSGVILAYRDTRELVEAESGGYDSQIQPISEPQTMQPNVRIPGAVAPPRGIAQPPISQGDFRSLGQHTFSDGSTVQIVVTGPITNQEAHKAATKLLEVYKIMEGLRTPKEEDAPLRLSPSEQKEPDNKSDDILDSQA